MSEVNVQVQRREETGKNANRRLRTTGYVPAVVYGGGKDPVPIQVERGSLHDLLKQEGGEHAVFLLSMAGTDKSRHTMIRDLDIDPITRQILHVDFQRIDLKQKVRVAVQIEPVGTPVGVKNEGGVLDFVTREVNIESLPTDIPPSLRVDVSELAVGDHVEASEIELPDGVELMDEPTKTIFSVAHSRVAAELEAEEEAEEGEELLEAELAEPEVIGKGKDEEEEPEAE